MDWTVLVTTAPRRDCTLSRCLISLTDCGWDPVVFAEPNSTPTEWLTFHNSEKKGAWHNWKSSIEWALNNTSSDLILTIQDDVIVHPESKTFIEDCLWPSPNTGFISLYCPSHFQYRAGYVAKTPGLYQMQVKLIYGACALLFPRKVLEQMVETKIFKSWMGLQPKTNVFEIMEQRKKDSSIIKHIDNAISDMLKELGRSYWYVVPSLSEHISPHSTLGHAPNVGRRHAGKLAKATIPLHEQIAIPPLYGLNL